MAIHVFLERGCLDCPKFHRQSKINAWWLLRHFKYITHLLTFSNLQHLSCLLAIGMLAASLPFLALATCLNVSLHLFPGAINACLPACLPACIVTARSKRPLAGAGTVELKPRFLFHPHGGCLPGCLHESLPSSGKVRKPSCVCRDLQTWSAQSSYYSQTTWSSTGPSSQPIIQTQAPTDHINPLPPLMSYLSRCKALQIPSQLQPHLRKACT